jgi:hypothetical protein
MEADSHGISLQTVHSFHRVSSGGDAKKTGLRRGPVPIFAGFMLCFALEEDESELAIVSNDCSVGHQSAVSPAASDSSSQGVLANADVCILENLVLSILAANSEPMTAQQVANVANASRRYILQAVFALQDRGDILTDDGRSYWLRKGIF